MDQTPPLTLPVRLASAARRVGACARAAAAQAVDSLGLAAMGSTQLLKRDAFLAAQYELNRKLEPFALVFDEALHTEVARQTGQLAPNQAPAASPEALLDSWERLSLVGEQEMDLHISAERLALDIAHTCDWELREFDAYMATLMALPAADHHRNPLRAEVVAQAMLKAVDAVSGRPEVRQVLVAEIGRALGQLLRQAYAAVVAELRQAGIRPVSLAIRQSASRDAAATQHSSAGPGAWPDLQRFTPAGTDQADLRRATAANSLPAPFNASNWAADPTEARADQPSKSPAQHPGQVPAGHRPGTPLGQVDAGVMRLIRQLSQPLPSWAEASQPLPHVQGQPVSADNLIQTHRDALRQATGSPLDHLVIDLVAGLFDQILSDAKVPPRFARLIARLQMPVLRAALGDSRFFASRRHPVRRFINRIASLGAASDDGANAETTALLAQIGERVQAIVEGEFDEAEVYEQQLQSLEAFVAAQAQAELHQLGDADQVLARKEAELLAQKRFAQDLDAALQDLPLPGYLRDLMRQVWSRAIARVEHKEGPTSPLALRLREAGKDLVMSVQPKGMPAQRQAFLRRLPQLMKDLNLGLDHARCPEPERRAFFAQLLPDHAQALKAPPLSTLEHNLLLRKVEQALATPVRTPADACPGPAIQAPMPEPSPLTVQPLAADASFSPAEAQAIGLLHEQAVDWLAPVALDLNLDEPDVAAVDIAIDGLPPPEAPEPTRGASLADHVQIGFAYLMHLDGQWHKVRLAHVSAGRGFFVFTHGQQQRATVSFTHRMLHRLCEAGRLRAFENAYLIERATARARRQLAQLLPRRA